MYSFLKHKNKKDNLNIAKPKTFIKYLLRTLVFGKYNIFFWFIIKIFYNFSSKLILKKFLQSLYNDCKVIAGPFKGIRYVEAISAGSSLIPKLLGTYEAEIIPTINSLKKNKYSKIINIGAAEGYYAIGFSLIFPDTNIVAYEINKETKEFLDKMIKFNKKESQITTSENLCYEDFNKISSELRLLIFSDCEGYEHELFNNDIIKKFINSDLILEMHTNNFDKTTLEKNFEKSHYIERINLDKHMINISQYSDLIINLKDYINIYAENRSEYHYFIVLRSKNHN